ncbi:hypothetical protein [Bosea thiooxidans]
MVLRFSVQRAGLVLGTLSVLAVVSLSAGPAEAVVYCKTVGVPKGCVARPAPVVVAPAPVVGAPVARAAVVTPGVGAPGVGVTRGVGVGARGVGVRPGTPANRGGPVNRVGRR